MASLGAAVQDATTYLDEKTVFFLQHKAILEKRLVVRPDVFMVLSGFAMGLLPLLFLCSRSELKAPASKELAPVTLCLLALTGGLDFFCTDQYQPSMPDMATAFNVTKSSMSLTIQAHQVFCGLATLIFGPVSDYIGRRKVFLFLQLLLVLSTTCCACAPSYHWFVVGRVLQGTGSSSIAIVLAISRDCYEKEEERLKVGGLLFACMLLGPLIAPPIGGFLATRFGWRSSFFMLAGVSSSIFLCSYFLVPETSPKAPKSSYLRAVWRIVANKRRFLLLLLMALYKSTFSILDNNNAFMLETFLGAPIQQASFMVSILALSGASGVLASSLLGRKPVEVMKLTMPVVFIVATCDLLVGLFSSKNLKLYLACICFRHFVIMLPNMAANIDFLQDLEDIAGMASSVQTAGVFSMASLFALPALLSEKQGPGGMLCVLATIIFLSQLLASAILRDQHEEPSEVLSSERAPGEKNSEAQRAQ